MSQELSYAGTLNRQWLRVRLALGPRALGSSLNFLHGGGRGTADGACNSRSPTSGWYQGSFREGSMPLGGAL